MNPYPEFLEPVYRYAESAEPRPQTQLDPDTEATLRAAQGKPATLVTHSLSEDGVTRNEQRVTLSRALLRLADLDD